MIKQFHKLSIYFILLKTILIVYLNPSKAVFSAFSFTFLTIPISFFRSLIQTSCFFHCNSYCNDCILFCYWYFNIDPLYNTMASADLQVVLPSQNSYLPIINFSSCISKEKKTKTEQTRFSFMSFCPSVLSSLYLTIGKRVA